jgi:glyoxylase-like metal-dependent hydrolase (beta-lactamase superfamily II)
MIDGIALPSADVGALEPVAPGIAGLRIAMVNVYGIRAPGGAWTLVDAGLYFSAGGIRRWAERSFGGARPQSIILTHGHFDHVGSLRGLADEWDVPVWAHTLELPYLTGRSKYPPPDPFAGRGALAFMAPLYPRGPIDISDRVRPLPEDGSVPGLPGWRWIATPGHSPGHVSFFREEDRVLIAGDAFATTDQSSASAVAVQRAELHGPPPYYTCDWDAAAQSVDRLAGLFPAVMAPGHGRPMVGPDAAGALQQLADNFDRYARPARGRYAHTPAYANENGVVSVPPPVIGPVPKLVAGAALAGIAVWAITRHNRAAG